MCDAKSDASRSIAARNVLARFEGAKKAEADYGAATAAATAEAVKGLEKAKTEVMRAGKPG